ncbi:hypothetical protein BD770DRAFT_370291 [Pilaira anomala]|nr:hypothetical protein BD770DRAFT_370291 [Pilaira anomala]
MAVSLVYLTWLVQWTLDRNDDPGARAATAGAIMLIIVQFIWTICLTSPEGSWFTRDGPRNFKNSSVGVSSANFTRKISNSVRPNHDTNHNNYHSRKNPNSPLPPRHDEEQDVGDDTSLNDRVEQATALHDYQGSPDDPNELSFSKNEVLDILDKRGNWWQARKRDGSTGIVPSNYVSLLI